MSDEEEVEEIIKTIEESKSEERAKKGKIQLKIVHLH